MAELKLSEYLQFLRRRAGLTQQEVADNLKINRSTCSYYETGKTEPNLDTIKKLAALYDVSIEKLLQDRMSRSEIVADIGSESDEKKRASLESRINHDIVVSLKSLTVEEKKEILANIRNKLYNRS